MFRGLKQIHSRLSFLAAYLSLAICGGQQHPLPTFGTTVVIPGGLIGKVYHIPAIDALPKFEKLEPVGTIYTKVLYVPLREFTEGFPGVTDRIEWFAIDYTGRIYIDRPGNYRFHLNSDDGSILYIDGKLVINNDPFHGREGIGTVVKLGGGIHGIRVSYYQGPRYHLSLMLTVAGPGDKRFRPFNTDDFAAPTNPADWKYGSPDALLLPPNPDAGRTRLRDVIRPDPVVSLSLQVLSHDQPVRDLKQSDFIVRDEGESQVITGFSFADQPLDLFLLFDASPGMKPFIERVKATAQRALSQLDGRDRVGIVLFGEEPEIALDLASDREMVTAAIRKIHTGPFGPGGKDLNGAVALTAHDLRDRARPESTVAMVILTDNDGSKGIISDRATRDALWQTNVILSGLLARVGTTVGTTVGTSIGAGTPRNPDGATGDRPQPADVRQFIEATGGEMLSMDERNIPLAEILRSLRERYRIAYRAPGGKPKTIRGISVELTGEARARLPDARIRVRGAHVVEDSSGTH
jgi:VWFA-related protein